MEHLGLNSGNENNLGRWKPVSRHSFRYILFSLGFSLELITDMGNSNFHTEPEESTIIGQSTAK